MPFDGDLYSDSQTFVNGFDNHYNSAFQTSDDIFENDGLIQSQAMAGVGNSNGVNFDLDHLSINFDEQSIGYFNAFGSHTGSLPLLNGNNHIQSVPYPIQTS